MFKNILFKMSFVIIVLGPAYGCDEGQEEDARTPKRGVTSGLTPKEINPPLEDASGPENNLALFHLYQFGGFLKEKKYVDAVDSFEKALTLMPDLGSMFFSGAATACLRMAHEGYNPSQKHYYLEKARVYLEESSLRDPNPTLESLRMARDAIMETKSIKNLAQINAKILSLVQEPTQIEDLSALYYQAIIDENEDQAYEWWQVIMRTPKNIERLTPEMIENGFELCVCRQDMKGVAQAFDLIKNKKEFLQKNEIYYLAALGSYLQLGSYQKVLDLLTLCGRKNNLQELELVVCLNTECGLFKDALVACEALIKMSPTRASYLGAISVCEKALKNTKLQAQKNFYAQKIKFLISKMPKDKSDKGHKKTVSHDVNRVCHLFIAQRYMDSAASLLARLPRENTPVLASLQDKIDMSYKECVSIFEAVHAGNDTTGVYKMYDHIEVMEKALKAIKAEKEKIYLQEKRLQVSGNTSLESPLLFQAPPVNLRKEVLEGHGLSQKREKPENVEDDAPIFKIVMPQDDTPHDITWQWTSKSQKQKDSLSIEAQEKLNTFMTEITRNPWSVRRDGSLALGEPRFVTGSLFGQNTYERDMDAYNRFIYNVTATGPKSARVMILGVQGHL
jgi:tetratricopeptide (TPR) repeat protein